MTANNSVKALGKDVANKVVVTDFPKVDLHLPKQK